MHRDTFYTICRRLGYDVKTVNRTALEMSHKQKDTYPYFDIIQKFGISSPQQLFDYLKYSEDLGLWLHQMKSEDFESLYETMMGQKFDREKLRSKFETITQQPLPTTDEEWEV